MTDESRSLLYQRLVERGMSVRKLAEESGIHRNTLNNLFNGAQVNLQAKSIEKIFEFTLFTLRNSRLDE